MLERILRGLGSAVTGPGAMEKDPAEAFKMYAPPNLLDVFTPEQQAQFGRQIQSQQRYFNPDMRAKFPDVQKQIMDAAQLAMAQKQQQQMQQQLGGIFGGGGDPAAAAPSQAMPQPNPAIAQVIQTAAQRHGVDPNALMTIAQIESNFDPAAKNPKSSAGGLFQMLDATAQQYGLQNKNDPMQSADAAARLMKDNAAVMRRALDREPTSQELYLAHQQGATGALRLLQNPNARAVDVVGPQAVLLNGGSADMTAGDFASKWMSRAQAAQSPQAPQAMQGQAQASQQGQVPQGGQPGQGGYDRRTSANRYFQAAKVFASRGDPETAKKYVDMGMQLHPNPSEAVRDLEYFGFPMQGQGTAAFDRLSQLNQSKAANTNINMPQNQFGSIPPGHRLVQNPQDGSYQMEVIPGSPAAREIEQQKQSDQFKQQNLERAGGTVVQDVGRALELLGGAGVLGAGRGAVVGKLDPESTASALNDLVASIKGNIGVDQLQQMRNASPTGGALGNVTERQLEGLQGLLGNLKVEGRRDLLDDNLKRVFNMYMDQIHGTPEQIRALAASGAVPPEVVEVLTFRHPLSFDQLGRPVQRPAPGQQSGGRRPALDEIFTPRQ
jgi:hypothetical protein